MSSPLPAGATLAGALEACGFDSAFAFLAGCGVLGAVAGRLPACTSSNLHQTPLPCCHKLSAQSMIRPGDLTLAGIPAASSSSSSSSSSAATTTPCCIGIPLIEEPLCKERSRHYMQIYAKCTAGGSKEQHSRGCGAPSSSSSSSSSSSIAPALAASCRLIAASIAAAPAAAPSSSSSSSSSCASHLHASGQRCVFH